MSDEIYNRLKLYLEFVANMRKGLPKAVEKLQDNLNELNRGKKILLIEDQEEMRNLLTARLKRSGYAVDVAKDGVEGLEKARKTIPDLVISDLVMPAMTGNVVVRIMKSNDKLKHIPVIMLSAFIEERMQMNVEVPADAYIPKPFEWEELAAKIEELLLKQRKQKEVL